MAGNDKIAVELVEIKALLKRAQRRTIIQRLESIGLAAMFGSLSLQAIEAPHWWFLLAVGAILIIIAPEVVKK